MRPLLHLNIWLWPLEAKPSPSSLSEAKPLFSNISAAFTLTLNEVKKNGLSGILRRFAPQDKLNQYFPLNGIPPLAGKMHCWSNLATRCLFFLRRGFSANRLAIFVKKFHMLYVVICESGDSSIRVNYTKASISPRMVFKRNYSI